MKKKISPRKSKTKQFKKVVSEDQIHFKGDTSNQTIAKAFHIALNLKISSAHSHNADLIVNDGQVKNAVIKAYCNDREQNKLYSNL